MAGKIERRVCIICGQNKTIGNFGKITGKDDDPARFNTCHQCVQRLLGVYLPDKVFDLEFEKKYRGGWGELIASAWLLEQGFEVYRNVCDRGIADVAAWKDGLFYRFEVKVVQVNRLRTNKKLVVRGRHPSAEQKKQGVRLLYVTPDGLCAFRAEELTAIYERTKKS